MILRYPGGDGYALGACAGGGGGLPEYTHTTTGLAVQTTRSQVRLYSPLLSATLPYQLSYLEGADSTNGMIPVCSPFYALSILVDEVRQRT
jgi:hypothetical protein